MGAPSFERSLAVLVVDDDPWFRVLARKFLEGSGYRVLEADSVEEGLRALRKDRIDLMITDIMMPESPGFAIIAGAKKEFPMVKILAVSGVATEDGYLRSARLLGADATLEKPVTAESLNNSVHLLLSQLR